MIGKQVKQINRRRFEGSGKRGPLSKENKMSFKVPITVRKNIVVKMKIEEHGKNKEQSTDRKKRE